MSELDEVFMPAWWLKPGQPIVTGQLIGHDENGREVYATRTAVR